MVSCLCAAVPRRPPLYVANHAVLREKRVIKSVMKMSDDEIRSACISRYRAAPEPAGNSMSM